MLRCGLQRSRRPGQKVEKSDCKNQNSVAQLCHKVQLGGAVQRSCREAIHEEVQQQPDAELCGAVSELQLTKLPQPSEERNVSKTSEEGAVTLSTGTAKLLGKRKRESESEPGVKEKGASPTKKESPSISRTIPNLTTLIRLIIEAQDLSDEQRRTVYKFLALHTQAYVNSRNFPAADLELVGAFIEHVEKVYDVALMSANVGSLEIVIHCPTLESLEHLWSDYLSGHLNEVAETFLITDEIKRMLKLETIRLKTTIEEENYLRCRKALVEMSVMPLKDVFEDFRKSKATLEKIHNDTIEYFDEIVRQ